VEGPDEEGVILTMVQLLMAFLTDGVMEAVAATRRTYLVEIGRYFDQRGLAARPTVRRASS